jgi:indolepyruvate ferredoxin oxidoreductase alpha subunit
LPGEADCLIVMEMSEMLRPGFLEMLREGGTILAANTVLVPQGLKAEEYPDMDKIRQAAAGFKLVEINVLAAALDLGDTTGRIANVVMMGALSRLAPFSKIPESLWLRALQQVTPKPAWPGNYHAFLTGRKLI